MCIGIVLRRYNAAASCDAIIAGHFNTATMFDETTNILTDAGTAFVVTFKQLIEENGIVIDGNVDVEYFYAPRVDGSIPPTTNEAYEKIKEELGLEGSLKPTPTGLSHFRVKVDN